MFDLVVIRYALHHFLEIEKSLMDVSRALKRGGRLFISDPRPNECDLTRFVDDYMRLKKDGQGEEGIDSGKISWYYIASDI